MSADQSPARPLSLLRPETTGGDAGFDVEGRARVLEAVVAELADDHQRMMSLLDRAIARLEPGGPASPGDDRLAAVLDDAVSRIAEPSPEAAGSSHRQPAPPNPTAGEAGVLGSEVEDRSSAPKEASAGAAGGAPRDQLDGAPEDSIASTHPSWRSRASDDATGHVRVVPGYREAADAWPDEPVEPPAERRSSPTPPAAGAAPAAGGLASAPAPAAEPAPAATPAGRPVWQANLLAAAVAAVVLVLAIVLVNTLG